MSKKVLLRLATSICFMLCVIFLGQINALADEVKPVHEYTFDSDIRTIVVDSGSIVLDGSSKGTNHETFFTGYNGTGKARYFNGKDDYLICSSTIKSGAKSVRFKVKKDPLTVSNKIEAIISTNDTDLQRGCFIGIGSDSLNNLGANHPTLSAKTGTLYILSYYYANKINYEIQTPESICDGKWHDILFTWDGTTKVNSVKLYLDDMSTPVAQTTAVSTKDDLYTGTAIGVNPSTYKTNFYNGYLDDVQFYNSAILPVASPDTSSNLKAVGGDTKIDLSWNPVTDATSYIVKRSMTAGGPYTSIATGITGTTYTDTDVTNGTTYYYVVTAIVNGSESWSSNEALATPQASTDPNQPTGNKALLVITMVTGERKEYEMITDKINNFIAWYNSKAASSPTYVIEKDYNKASFTARKDYITYDQISNFEVNEYNN